VDYTGEIPLAHCELVREFFEKSMVSETLVQSLNGLLKSRCPTASRCRMM
jgi:hypothetical protein